MCSRRARKRKSSRSTFYSPVDACELCGGLRLFSQIPQTGPGVSYDRWSRFGPAVIRAASPGRGSAAHLSLGRRPVLAEGHSAERRPPSIGRLGARLGLRADERGDGQAALDLGDVDAKLALLPRELSSSSVGSALPAVELVLPHLQVDVDADLAALELLLPPRDVLEALLDERLAVVDALLAVLDPRVAGWRSRR